MKYTFRIAQNQFEEMKTFLFQDDNECAMLGLCSYETSSSSDVVLMLHELIEVPISICERSPNRIIWPTSFSDEFLETALSKKLTIVKIHSHPSDYTSFSETDNNSDKPLFDYYNAYFNDGRPTASLVMVPDGFIFGRIIKPEGTFNDIDKVSVIGKAQRYFYSSTDIQLTPEYLIRNEQAFGKYTTDTLQKIKVGVVGCSGLGTPVILELARSGIGELILVDNEKIGVENLNRIFGASKSDIGKYKVEFFKEKLEQYGLDVKVKAIKADVIESRVAQDELTYCDHIFGCTDKYLPRDFINRLATFFIIGYTDLSVGLKADTKGGIDSIVGWVRYLIPGGSSLFTRQMYDAQDLERESLKLKSPEEYVKKEDAGYIKGAEEESPTVISINTAIASLGVTDFLNRIHQFKYKDEIGFCLDFCENIIESEPIYPNSAFLRKNVGRGKVEPYLDYII